MVITTQPSALMNKVLQQTDRLSVQSRRELEQVIQRLALRKNLAQGNRAK
ncbi:hypothetical protein JZM24_07180 [Candidatus Sodalis endolongispinus]|uniref:Uncharacterized protein n=1 Tax=Candidatus Sodalis endolongispinus TaxID=2812662 RepID=A0ABS5YAD6_9GAMM|nr:hypothetical protein [Candidatus Sodalis endolongispinus]MBT9431971.1 hypothetical protein [Candidatus Sodalis endolongispinus]